MLSAGFTEDPLIVWTVPRTDYFVAFLSTIKEDSEISADAAPFLFALELEAADSVWFELDEIWLTAFLSKQLFMYGLLSVWLTTFNPFLNLLAMDVDPLASLLIPANPEGLWLLALALEFDLDELIESLLLTKLLTLTTLTWEVEWCETWAFGSALIVCSMLAFAKSSC